MSVNIRNYVSNDHIESIGEIAKSQSAIIQALSIDNSKLQQELRRKDNIINELKEELYHIYNYAGLDTNNLKDKIKELEGDNK